MFVFFNKELQAFDIFKADVAFVGRSIVLSTDGLDGVVEFMDFETDMFRIDGVLKFLDFLD